MTGNNVASSSGNHFMGNKIIKILKTIMVCVNNNTQSAMAKSRHTMPKSVMPMAVLSIHVVPTC